PAELARELAERGPRRAYLLAGAESLLREDALAALRRAVIGDGDPAFLLDRFDGSAAPGELTDALHTLPVIAPRRLVVLEEPEARGASARGAQGAEGERSGRPPGTARALIDAVADWIGDAREASSPAVLVVAASQPDRRARWVKAFGDAIVECD